MRLIDSHSHLFLEEFAGDLPQVMARAREAGVTHIFMPNIDSTTIKPMLRVCREYKGYCYPMIGLHPTSVDADYEKELDIVARELASSNEFVAVGEIGMDLYWDKTFLREQQRALGRQIEWALEYSLPVVLHCREAFDHIYNVLKPYQQTPLKGIFHSFTGDLGRGLQDYGICGFYDRNKWCGDFQEINFARSLEEYSFGTYRAGNRFPLSDSGSQSRQEERNRIC
mgnify:CR=1 FL=1